MTNWKHVHDLAARTHGRFRLSDLDAKAEGISPDAVRAHLRANPHLRVGQNVARLTLDSGPLQKLAEAVLAVGPPCAVSGHAALWLHGLWNAIPRPPEIVVPHTRRLQESELFALRRDRRFDDGHVRNVHDLPCLDVASAITNLTLGGADMLGTALTARQRRLLRDRDLVEQDVRRASRYPGRPALHELIAALTRDGSDSMLEHDGRDLLVAAGIPLHPHPMPWLAEAGAILHPDAVAKDTAVAIEFDGFAVHSLEEQFEIDRADRWPELQRAFDLVWVTSKQVREDPEGVVARVQRQIAVSTKPVPTWASCPCPACSRHRRSGCPCPACSLSLA